MGTHPIFESDFDCLTERFIMSGKPEKYQAVEFEVPKVDKDGNPISKSEQKRMIKELKKQKEQQEKQAKKAAANPKKEGAKVSNDEDNLTPNQYTEIRKKKLEEQRKEGTNPYPHKFHVSTGMQEFCDKYKDIADGSQLDEVISCAGRIYDMRAEGAKIQIMANMAAYETGDAAFSDIIAQF